ncbi:hypothetical protein JTB14_020240 [Gonioctena quinquepunctata]|nr:hypothetical protein JTB14_020240 [Gonioctena quinquepunctata]
MNTYSKDFCVGRLLTASRLNQTWLIMSKRTRKTDEEIREAVDAVVNQELSENRNIPFHSSIFTEDDFLASSVTDWPNPCNKETQEQDIQDKKCNDLPEVGGLDIVSQSI